jgi:hypothetical protein
MPHPPIDAAPQPRAPRRRTGREAPQALTAAFRRYVERVQSAEDPTPRDDLDAALTLAEEITGQRRGSLDAVLLAAYGPSMRQLARSVRIAGGGAVAHPALLARAIVVAREVARTGGARRPAAGSMRAVAVAGRS